MDLLDLKILKALQSSGRKKNAELARELGVAPSTMMERIRRLDPARDGDSPPAGEGACGDQVHHEAEADSRLYPVELAEAPERAVVRHAGPTLFATHDQAQAVVEGHARFDLRSR